MARPIKNNADYFSHDAGMRDHKKVKAIRLKFGIQGYAIWSMLLEYLTANDGNVFPYTDLEFELMSGDFGVSATEIRSVVDYCISLEMLFNRNGFVNSDSLDERLAPVYEKRGKAKELSQKQLRENGKFASNNTEPTVVSVTETPQSKVKESKVEETKEKQSKAVEPDFELFEKWSQSIISGQDFYFTQKFQNEFPNWGGGAAKFVEIVNDHLDLLNRYPNMNPHTQQRFRASVIKHFREYKEKPNGKGKGLDVESELRHIYGNQGVG